MKIIILNLFATDDHGAFMSYLERSVRYLWPEGRGEGKFFKIRVGVGMCFKYILEFFGGITFGIMLLQLSRLCYRFAQMY